MLQGDVHLTTTYYKVLLTQALDLFLDLAYFHLELLAIAVKGMVSRLLELSEGDAATQHGINYKEMKGDKAGAIDSSTQLVIFQSSLLTNNCKFHSLSLLECFSFEPTYDLMTYDELRTSLCNKEMMLFKYWFLHWLELSNYIEMSFSL